MSKKTAAKLYSFLTKAWLTVCWLVNAYMTEPPAELFPGYSMVGCLLVIETLT